MIRYKKYIETLTLKSDDELKPYLIGNKDAYLSRYEVGGYKILLTQDSNNSEGIYVITMAKKDASGNYNLLTVHDIMTNKNVHGRLEFLNPLVDFLKNYIIKDGSGNDNPIFDYFFTWVPPITKNDYHEYFLDLTDVFYLEIQRNGYGLNCSYRDYRGEQFKKTIYDNPKTQFEEINHRPWGEQILDIASITYQTRPDDFIHVCDQFYPDDKNKKKTTLVTIDNREKEDKYNHRTYCHITDLLKREEQSAYFFLEKVFRVYFDRINKDFIDTNPLNTNNYGVMLFARGMQVPLVHYKMKHADEYLNLRPFAYNNIKNTVGKLKSLLTTSRMVEYVNHLGGSDNKKKKCPNIKIDYNLLFNLYDSTSKDDSEYEYKMKLKTLLQKFKEYGLEFDDAINITASASNYIIDIFTLKKILKVEKEKLVDIINISESVFTPKIPYNVDYKFYLKLKEKIKDKRLDNIFIQVKNLLRTGRITKNSFYFINVNISEDEKQFIINEGNTLYHNIDYKTTINNKFEYTFEYENVEKIKDLIFRLDENDSMKNIDLFSYANILLYIFDKNNDNLLDISEFFKYINETEKLIEKINKSVAPIKQINFQPLDLLKLYKHFDTENDNKINTREFFNIIKHDLYKKENVNGAQIVFDKNYRRNIRHSEFTNILKKISIGANPTIGDYYFLFSWIKKIILVDNIRHYININPPEPDEDNDFEKHIFTVIAQKYLINYSYTNLNTRDFTITSAQNIVKFITLLTDEDKKGNVLIHCGAGDGRSGFLLLSLLVYKNLNDDYITLVQKFFCVYRYLAFREIFGDSTRYNLLIGRLLYLYVAITKLLNKDDTSNTYPIRPLFLKISDTFEDAFKKLVNDVFDDTYYKKYITKDDVKQWSSDNGGSMKSIFDFNSYKKIDKVFRFINDPRGNEKFFKNRINWDRLLDIPDYLIDRYDIFTYSDNVLEKNNFKVIKTNSRHYQLENSVINNFDTGINNDWKFRKSINNIFTEFYMTTPYTIDLLITISKYIYNECNTKLNEYKTTNNIPDDDIYIYFKGGFLFYLLNKKTPVSFEETKKSDFDLDVYLNPDISNYELHFLNVNKLIFNVLDTFNTNPAGPVSVPIKYLIDAIYSADKLSQLYNKLNEHIKNYDKSELSDEFKNVQGITQLQFNNHVYYTMDETSENANIYKYNEYTDNLDIIRGLTYDKPKMDVDKNIELRDLLYKIPYKDEEKVLTNKIDVHNYTSDNYKLFLQESKNILTYTDENLQHIFTGIYKPDGTARFKLSYNSSHYYKKNTNEVTSFNLFRLLIPNYLLLSYNNEGVKSYKIKSFFNEILDISIIKKNDFSFNYSSKSDITDYNLVIDHVYDSETGEDKDIIFSFKGKNIEGLLKDLVYQFKDTTYDKKEKRGKRFSEILILYIDTLKMNAKAKERLYNDIYKILNNGEVPDLIDDQTILFITTNLKNLYDNYEENSEIIKVILVSKIDYVFKSGPIDKTSYYDNLTYRKYMKYKMKYLNLLKKLKNN